MSTNIWKKNAVLKHINRLTNWSQVKFIKLNTLVFWIKVDFTIFNKNWSDDKKMKQGHSNTGIIKEKVTIQMKVTIVSSGDGHYNTMTRVKVKNGEGHNTFYQMKITCGKLKSWRSQGL